MTWNEYKAELAALGFRTEDYRSELFAHFSPEGRVAELVKALRTANERAWNSFEVALAGNSWWQQIKRYLTQLNLLLIPARVPLQGP